MPLGWLSTIGGSPETVTVSLAPATASLNVNSVVPPTSTRRRGVVCGDIPGESARAEYSPGGSSSKAKRPLTSLVVE